MGYVIWHTLVSGARSRNFISPARLSAQRADDRRDPRVCMWEMGKKCENLISGPLFVNRDAEEASCYLCYGGGLEVHLCMVSWEREKRKRNQFHTQLHAPDTREDYSVGPNHVPKHFIQWDGNASEKLWLGRFGLEMDYIPLMENSPNLWSCQSHKKMSACWKSLEFTTW